MWRTGLAGPKKKYEVGVCMKAILHQQKMSSILAALVTIALGVLLVWWPDRSMDFLCLMLGITIFAIGIIYILGWLARRKKGVPAFFVLPGVILCALGVWLMTSPDSVIILIQYIFGAILIFHGVIDLQGALALASHRWNRWWLDLLLTALTIGLGVLILLNPFGTFSALVILIGAALIYDGVSDLWIIWRLGRANKAAIRKAEEEERLAKEAELQAQAKETVEQIVQERESSGE